MYLPSDLANQYNEKHSCDKRFNNWLCNKNRLIKSGRQNYAHHYIKG